VDAVVAPPRSLCRSETLCQKYYQLKVHSCIPLWELHLAEGRYFIQGYALIPRDSLHPVTG